MRYVLRSRIPKPRRLLLIESGSRGILDRLQGELAKEYGPNVTIDLVTCFAGVPAGFDGDGAVYRVADFGGQDGPSRLRRILKANRYEIAGIICSGDPIMTKWKWYLALRLPVKLFIINENCDYFWFDYTQWRTIRHFVLFRLGLSGADAVSTIGRLLIFPFTLGYLLGYAGYVHLRRKLRQA